eukprot:CAMPEP_0171728192 /NCGR_PEP_ID=MMETSP0991-20121206/26801_1 /TAXON_ID=483369 /ORGANISM="non described non described, Strain CCMP2098" /LENGTH=89 /DNA_ID=CAMNT_0012322191 /DNA_START=378 /DNA_END=644 /DNA_ORIENTATION=-
MGDACPFAVLGASTVTGAALVEVDGNVGVSPGTAITSFPVGVDVAGDYHYGDTTSAAAQNALGFAIAQAQDRTPTRTLSSYAVDIGGRT